MTISVDHELSRGTSGLSLYLSIIVSIIGKDVLQGPHQVAQKSTTTTFPLKSSNETVLPSRSCKENAGAGSSIILEGNRARLRCLQLPPHALRDLPDPDGFIDLIKGLLVLAKRDEDLRTMGVDFRQDLCGAVVSHHRIMLSELIVLLFVQQGGIAVTAVNIGPHEIYWLFFDPGVRHDGFGINDLPPGTNIAGL